MNGFMRVYATKNNRQESQRVRTRDGQPICDNCERTGHTRHSCYAQTAQRLRSSQQGDPRFDAPTQHRNPGIAVISPEDNINGIVAQCTHHTSPSQGDTPPAPTLGVRAQEPHQFLRQI